MSVVEIFIKIFLGLYLFFGRKGLIKLWQEGVIKKWKGYREKTKLIDY
jgi:hypothetical protein